MLTFDQLLLLTLIGLIIVVPLLILANHRRAQFDVGQSLQPNCLLTQYPLLFLTGRRSIFYFQGYWNWIPRFLSDHGYEVMTLDLPWRKKGARRQVLEEFLRVADEKGLKFHFIGDATCESDLEWL